jgi:hypothetical protein
MKTVVSNPPKRGITMSATAKTLVVKQGKPSAPGTVVDTSAAKVVPPSSEVKAEAAKRDPDPVKKAAGKITSASNAKTGQIKKANAASLARDEEDKRQAVLTIKDDAESAEGGHKYKRTKATKKRSTGNGSGPAPARLTMEWTGKDKKDVAVKDRVRTADGIVLDVIGRWTRKAKTGNVPMVTGRIVTFGAAKTDATEGGKGKSVGDRCNAVADECTHVAKK